MALSSAQIKGRIKNIARKNKADARTLLRIYAMERFLERVSKSQYRNNFVLKGGVLVTAMVGISQRSTMDIDTSLRNINLTMMQVEKIIKEIINIGIDDGVSFTMKSITDIMDEMEYSGIRVLMNANVDNMVIPFKIDISTGDVITPGAIKYDYELLLENRSISLWSYNLESILSEKLQTILARGPLNTRMRDCYDVFILSRMYADKIDPLLLKKAYIATCQQRDTEYLLNGYKNIIQSIEESKSQMEFWRKYQDKYPYASAISFQDILQSTVQLLKLIY